MPAIDDTQNPAAGNSKLNLIQTFNTVAFLLKKITGENSWKIPATTSLADLAQTQQDLAPLDHQHAIAQVEGLQTALNSKSSIGHQHTITQVEGLQTALNAKAAIDHNHPPQVWQDIPLVSGWSNYATGFINPQCRKLVGDLIEVRGTIKKSTALVANEVVATLPVGYRPPATMHFITWASNGYSRLQVDSNGAMKLISGNNIGLGLNFIFGLN
jgi:hypothetical protein